MYICIREQEDFYIKNLDFFNSVVSILFRVDIDRFLNRVFKFLNRVVRFLNKVVKFLNRLVRLLNQVVRF